MKHRLAMDLDYILEHTQGLWNEFKDKSIFVTGGTGFIGTWLLETLVWANRYFDLNLTVTCLTRNPVAFAAKVPHLTQEPAVLFVTGDIRNFVFPEERFNYIIHGASEASAKLNQEHPQIMLDTIIQGTRHVLDFAAYAHAQKFLLLSSGGVYGQASPQVTRIREDYSGYLDVLNPQSAHAIGKQTAEHLCVLHAAKHSLQIKIARCFSFVGPYLPLDRHFAMGNFIRDAMAGQTIKVQGDGTPYRSYQYAADLMIWLLKILCHGKNCQPYNVGSEEAISIAELAALIAKVIAPDVPITIAQVADKNKPPIRYVPDVERARQELGLHTRITLPDAIRKTVQFYEKEVVHD